MCRLVVVKPPGEGAVGEEKDSLMPLASQRKLQDPEKGTSRTQLAFKAWETRIGKSKNTIHIFTNWWQYNLEKTIMEGGGSETRSIRTEG